MPRDTLKALDRDVERLLFAGAQVARADSDLDEKKAKLAPLAAKAPAIAKVKEQIDKVQSAQGKAAAVELLHLSALMAQVRGAQAAPAEAKGELTPFDATEPGHDGAASGPIPRTPQGPIESPLSAAEITTLVNVLTNAPDTKHRARLLNDAIERGAVRDLRILPFCVAALADAGIAHLVGTKLLPKLGAVVVPELVASLKLQGKETDARKLRALCEIQGAEAKGLLIEAIEKGSPEIRAAAITELSAIDAAATEPYALKLLAADRSEEVRKAAAKALGGATSDEALEALLKAFTATERLSPSAGAALAQLSHPKTTERVLALVTDELRALTPFKMPKGLTKAKKAEAEKAEREHAAKVRFFGAVLDLLASRKDRDTSGTVLSVFREHKVKEVRNAAARALLKGGYQGAFEELAPSVYDADWETRSEFIEHIVTQDPARAFDRLGPFLDPRTLKTPNHVSFAEHILDHIEGESDDLDEPVDEAAAEAQEAHEGEASGQSLSLLEKDGRWADACIALLELDKEGLVNSALDVLSKVRSPKALDAVIKLTSTKIKGHNAWRLLQVLTTYKDPRVPPLLLRFLDVLNGYWGRRAAYNALRTYDDPAVLPALKAWASGKRRLEKRDKDELDALIQFLERDRALSAGV
jgi:HEAT repeat protein